jgi:hypothetical protein
MRTNIYVHMKEVRESRVFEILVERSRLIVRFLGYITPEEEDEGDSG